jgi:hypothetical protein
MKFKLSSAIKYCIFEGYGRVSNMDYDRWQNDPQPQILQLGSFDHPTTGNNLIAGINLNYLTKKQVDALRKSLPEILKSKNLYTRYWTGRKLVPSVFNNSYRTYRSDAVKKVKKGTLNFMTPEELAEKGDEDAAQKLQNKLDQEVGIKPDDKDQDNIPDNTEKEAEDDVEKAIAKDEIPAVDIPEVGDDVPEKAGEEPPEEVLGPDEVSKDSDDIGKPVEGPGEPPEAIEEPIGEPEEEEEPGEGEELSSKQAIELTSIPPKEELEGLGVDPEDFQLSTEEKAEKDVEAAKAKNEMPATEHNEDEDAVEIDEEE